MRERTSRGSIALRIGSREYQAHEDRRLTGIYFVYTLNQMDVHFLFHGVRFVWDSEKASINLVKHGVSFEAACQVFFDPFVRMEDASVGEEQRDSAIGLAEDWSLLFVVHMVREGETIRVISARAATVRERRSYEDAE